MSTILKRYDMDWRYGDIVEEAEGDWVRAQDAYDKIAVMAAEITVLKTQLKDLKRKEK